MKIICSNCQAENNENSKYCSICGYKLTVEPNQIETTEIVQKGDNKAKSKFGIKSILAFVISFIVMFFIAESIFKPSIDKQLVEVTNELNKYCPMNVDEYTILKNVVALPNKAIQYNYSLIDIEKAEVKMDTVKKYVFPAVLENAKSNPQMKFFRDNNVTLKYNYTDKNGKFVTEYIVTSEMYK